MTLLTPPRAPLHAYILAGGRSSRFGSDKARAPLDGRPLLQRLAEALTPLTARVTAVAERAEKYGDLGVRTIADTRPGLGPMGGLGRALSDLPADQAWLLLLSCDLLEARAGWVEALLRAATDFAAEAVAFREQRWEPLFALYHRSIAPRVESHLDEGSLAMQRLLSEAQTVGLPRPADWPAVIQANTPADLDRYLRERG